MNAVSCQRPRASSGCQPAAKSSWTSASWAARACPRSGSRCDRGTRNDDDRPVTRLWPSRSNVTTWNSAERSSVRARTIVHHSGRVRSALGIGAATGAGRPEGVGSSAGARAFNGAGPWGSPDCRASGCVCLARRRARRNRGDPFRGHLHRSRRCPQAHRLLAVGRCPGAIRTDQGRRPGDRRGPTQPRRSTAARCSERGLDVARCRCAPPRGVAYRPCQMLLHLAVAPRWPRLSVNPARARDPFGTQDVPCYSHAAIASCSAPRSVIPVSSGEARCFSRLHRSERSCPTNEGRER